jgi:NAD(P)-dependent dehydrogenase (short-subunit alcohol dehydrogenase family)
LPSRDFSHRWIAEEGGEYTVKGLRGKVPLLPGRRRGNIGGSTVLRLAEEGMSVVVADLNSAAAEAVAEEIKSAGGSAAPHRLHTTVEQSYAELIAFTTNLFSGRSSCSNAR